MLSCSVNIPHSIIMISCHLVSHHNQRWFDLGGYAIICLCVHNKIMSLAYLNTFSTVCMLFLLSWMLHWWMIFALPVQAATGGRWGVSVYKAGRSVPLDSAQLDLSRLALPQLGSAGVEKCFEIHVPSSGLKTQKNRKRPEMHFTNRIRALAANLLQNVVRQETTRIRVPFPSFPNAQKSKHRFFLHNGMLHNPKHWLRNLCD